MATSARVAAPRQRSPQRITQSCPAASWTRQPSIRSSAGASSIGRRQPAHRCCGTRGPCAMCQRFCSSPHANRSAAARSSNCRIAARSSNRSRQSGGSGFPDRSPPAYSMGRAIEYRGEIVKIAAGARHRVGRHRTRLGGVPARPSQHLDELRREAMERARSARGLAAGWHGKTPGGALRLALVFEERQRPRSSCNTRGASSPDGLPSIASP